jgi:hypothetical protein
MCSKASVRTNCKHAGRAVLALTSISIVQIDIDCMDPAEAKRWLPFKPQDQTSNQRLVYEQMVSPNNREMFLRVVKEYKDQGWEAILDRMVSKSLHPHLLSRPQHC